MWAAKAKLNENLQLDGVSILKGFEMTITKGLNEDFCIWHYTGLYDIPSRFVGEIIKVYSND